MVNYLAVVFNICLENLKLVSLEISLFCVMERQLFFIPRAGLLCVAPLAVPELAL